jgi:hypothetical protein
MCERRLCLQTPQISRAPPQFYLESLQTSATDGLDSPHARVSRPVSGCLQSAPPSAMLLQSFCNHSPLLAPTALACKLPLIKTQCNVMRSHGALCKYLKSLVRGRIALSGRHVLHGRTKRERAERSEADDKPKIHPSHFSHDLQATTADQGLRIGTRVKRRHCLEAPPQLGEYLR